MNLRVPKMRGISWLAAEPVSFSRRTLLHGVSKTHVAMLQFTIQIYTCDKKPHSWSYKFCRHSTKLQSLSVQFHTKNHFLSTSHFRAWPNWQTFVTCGHLSRRGNSALVQVLATRPFHTDCPAMWCKAVWLYDTLPRSHHSIYWTSRQGAQLFERSGVPTLSAGGTRRTKITWRLFKWILR